MSSGIPVSNWNFDKSDFRTLFGFYRSALKTACVSKKKARREYQRTARARNVRPTGNYSDQIF